MELGCFSVSLAVKDLAASRAFYMKLGFTDRGGDPSQGYLIMTNGSTKIGLFQGMFEENILTFNPGWDDDAQPLSNFTDVREIKKRLSAEGVALEADETASASGPGHVVIRDPDGNQILIDQHV